MLFVSLCGVDLLRPPDRQMLASGYTACVGVYQWAKPRMGCEPCCRFVPSCSRYSVQAVQRYGIVRGLELTAGRLHRCRMNIPLGTPDPLPIDKASGFGEQAGNVKSCAYCQAATQFEIQILDKAQSHQR